MRNRFQNLWFALSFAASLYILVFALPAMLDGSAKVSTMKANEPQSLKPSPSLSTLVSQEFIKIKSSGEEPSLTDSEIDSFQKARREFEERFGYPLDIKGTSTAPVHYPFSIPEGIEEMVRYWVLVFGHYGKNQYIFSHKDDVTLIYGILDLSQKTEDDLGLTPQEFDAYKEKLVREEEGKISRRLKNLSQKISDGVASLDNEETRLLNLFNLSGRKPLSSLLDASKLENIRVQEGYKHRFRQAIIQSGQYMKEIERIFAFKGLPQELTRLPFVESAFNLKALSSAGARGLWQFIDSTGKNYLHIDDIADERLDPLLATYAAADHLKRDYELLGSWPLAINAYNTGTGRMQKAVEELQTKDIATIIGKFEEPGYQFFSRNYYPEFLAALEVYNNQQKYFGVVHKLSPWRYDLFFPSREIDLYSMARSVNISMEEMARLNPALSREVLQGERLLPRGYMARVPYKLGKLFERTALESSGEGMTLVEAESIMEQEKLRQETLFTIPEETSAVPESGPTAIHLGLQR